MKSLNYEKLMALKPTEYDQMVNALGQIVTFVEHPIDGDEYPVIAVFKDLKMAFVTDFFETDDMMASHGTHTIDQPRTHRMVLRRSRPHRRSSCV